MSRLGYVFIVGLFYTLGLNFSHDDIRQIETVQTLYPTISINTDMIDNSFKGESTLLSLQSNKFNINDLYQKTVFKRTLASTVKPKKKTPRYSTWIEHKECHSSPFMERPVRARVTSRFGTRVHPLTRRRHVHAGIDFRGKRGTPVTAAAKGIVKSVSRKGAYGKTIIISHGNNYTTLYGHLSSYAIQPGDWVNLGQTIGYIGRTGRATGPHLHFEVRCHNLPQNPIAFLGRSNKSVAVRFRRRRRRGTYLPQRRLANTTRRKSVKRGPNYYTRLINLQKLQKLKKNIR